MPTSSPSLPSLIRSAAKSVLDEALYLAIRSALASVGAIPLGAATASALAIRPAAQDISRRVRF